MKLTKEDKIILNAFDTDYLYIARNPSGLQVFFDDKPSFHDGCWSYATYADRGYSVYLKETLFSFIEKGRIWSKSELMELEVQE